MRQLVVWAIAALLATALAGCGGTHSTTSSTTGAATAETTSSTTVPNNSGAGTGANGTTTPARDRPSATCAACGPNKWTARCTPSHSLSVAG